MRKKIRLLITLNGRKFLLSGVGFNAEGIAKHTQDFCNEQRRYHKLKTSNSKVNVLPL